MSLPDARHHVFVYGTLRPGGYYHRRLVEGRPVEATPARVRGALYALAPGYPGMRPGDRWVAGEVLSFDADELLGALDELEGYASADPAGGEYERASCEAWTPDGTLLGTVWAYWILPAKLIEYEGRPVERWDHLGGPA
ncbi:MAG: gamma-glutamylcyclotransferase [Opitutales bacterium]